MIASLSQALVLGGDAVPVSWALVLEPIDEMSTPPRSLGQ